MITLVLAAIVGLLLAAARVGLDVERASEIDPAELVAIVDALGRAVEARAGLVAVARPLDAPPCAGEQCVAELREKMNADDIIRIELFGGLTRVRLIAKHFSPRRTAPLEGQVDLSRGDRERWREPLIELSRTLFPEVRAQAGAPPPPLEHSHIAPLAVLFGAGLAAGVGIGFGVASQSARNGLEPGLASAQVEELEDRANRNARLANILFGAAAAGLLASVLMLWMD